MSKVVCAGTLSNKISVQLVEAESFTGKIDVAVMVSDEIASVVSVYVMKNQDIAVKGSSKNFRIKAKPVVTTPATAVPPETKPAPTLSDVK